MRYLNLLLLTLLVSFSASAALPPILGPATVCTGMGTTLTNSVTGGTWTSSDVSVATIGASSGFLNGLTAGTAIITYTDGTDFAYSTVTVNASPTPIGGTLSACIGGLATIGSTPGGGTWTSGLPPVATVATASPTSAVVTPVSAGTASLSYTAPNGCVAMAVFTVNGTAILSGPPNICIGSPETISASVGGGTWSVAPTSIATITAGGVVSGVAPGTATVSYVTAAGCSSSYTINILGSVAPITGPGLICLGTPSTLSHSTPGGTWISTNIIVATVSSAGLVTGNSVGTTSISYILSSGCSATTVVTVSTAPGSITGTATLCAGSHTTLSILSAGGTWASSASSVATVGTGGVVYGTGTGTATISYIVGSCGTATRVVTVTSSCTGTPVPGIITSSAPVVCIGTPLTLNLPAYTYSCGNIIQWEYSSDGLSWATLSGANTVPYTYNPTAGYYYRCRITCYSTGLTAYSGPLYVGVEYAIGSHTVIPAPSVTCSPSHFYVSGCGVSSAFTVITAFGDGTYDTSALTGSPVSDAHIYHTYAMAGTYSVRHTLYNAGTPVDTVLFSYENNYCSTLPVRLFRDINGNCTMDAGEPYNNSATAVQIDSAGVVLDTVLVTSGFNYVARGPVGTIYAFRHIPVSGGLISSCFSGVVYDTIVALVNTYPVRKIALSCGMSSSFDLTANATVQTGRHSQQFTVLVKNNLCTPVSPVLKINFSPKYGYFTGYTSTSPAPSSVVGNTATWNLPSLGAFETRTVLLRLERPASIGPLLIPGDTAMSSIIVSPFVGDADTNNNVIIRTDTVKSSYDPNDIAVSPAGYILPCTWLEYRVRFENTGNDTAHNIHVLDTLPAAVDPASVEILSASHFMNYALINDGVNNIVKFDFPNIMLPDTSHHNMADGAFFFRVRTYSGLADGTDIMNRVGIYFDDNEVVMTNEVHNTIGIAPIEGPGHICLTLPDTLFNSTPGGVWASSNTAVGTINDTGIVTPIVAGTTTISYTVTNGCASRTATKEVTVAPIVAASVSIVTTDDTVCSGSPVIFTTLPVAGGVAPSYYWSVNGTIVSAGDAYSYLPTDGDNVSVTMTSSQACTDPSVVADTLTMTVLPTGTPVSYLSVSPNDTSCAGTLVTFTATPFMGGTAPGYQWYVNGAFSGTGATHSYIPVDGDVVYCRMGSNYLCRLADTVNSVVIHQTVDPLYIPVVSISAAPGLVVNAGDPITFIATASGAGPTPVYEWYVNSIPVSGVTTGTFTTTTLADYDSVTCRITGSGVCAVTSFNYVYVTILPVGLTSVTGDDMIRIFPNPNNGNFHIKGVVTNGAADAVVTISDMLGRVVMSRSAAVSRGAIDETVVMPAQLAAGVYMLTIQSGEERKTFRIVMER